MWDIGVCGLGYLAFRVCASAIRVRVWGIWGLGFGVFRVWVGGVVGL